MQGQPVSGSNRPPSFNPQAQPGDYTVQQAPQPGWQVLPNSTSQGRYLSGTTALPNGSYQNGQSQQAPLQLEQYPNTQQRTVQNMKPTVQIPYQHSQNNAARYVPVHNVQGAQINHPNPNLTSQLSYNSNNLSRLNSSKLNRTIVNELIDPQSDDDVMDRIETQNNIVEGINEIPNYEKEYAVPEEELEDIRQKRDFDIFHCIVPDYRLEDIYEMQHYQLVRGGGAASVYSLDSNHRSLKLLMDVPHPREKVLAALIDPGNYHLWNDQVDLGNIKLRIYSENTVIAYQKHKAFDSHYRQRDFLYIRHLFQKNGVIYIVDKSVEHSNFPPFDYITRGEIKLALWAFQDVGGSATKITYMLHMKFGGTLGGNKSAESMIRYLESMAKLTNYLSRNGKIQTKIRDYFDLNWGLNARVDNTINTPNREQYEQAMSFDGNEELYMTAFPEADWLDRTAEISFQKKSTYKEQSRVLPATLDPNSQQFLHNEIVNSYNRSKLLYEQNGSKATMPSQVKPNQLQPPPQEQWQEGYKYINGKPVRPQDEAASSSNKLTQKTSSMKVQNTNRNNDTMTAPLAPLPSVQLAIIPEHNGYVESSSQLGSANHSPHDSRPMPPPRQMGPPVVNMLTPSIIHNQPPPSPEFNRMAMPGQQINPLVTVQQHMMQTIPQVQQAVNSRVAPPTPNYQSRQQVPNQQISKTSPSSVQLQQSARREAPPPPSELVRRTTSKAHLKAPPATFNDGHSSGQEDFEISKPEQVHVFKQISVKFDQDGLVKLPNDYLKVKHKLAPVKSDYKLIKKEGWKDYFLKNVWQVNPTGELRCINAEILKEQHGVMSYILKKFAKNLLTGKSILSVSLPVTVFGELSYLELFARSFGFAPLYLEKAAVEGNPVERLKLLIGFAIAYGNLFIDMEKPFNPILGETFQGWVNGCPVYCQQISHHPPISSLLMLGRGYRVSGSFEPTIDISVNSATGTNHGEYKIRFEKYPKNSAYFQTMCGDMGGVSYGDRTFSFSGKTHFYDDEGHFLQLTFNPYKKGLLSFGKQTHPNDYVEGNIVKTSPAFITKFRANKKRQGPSKKQIVQTLATVNGRWTQSVKVDGIDYYNMQRDQPCFMEQQPYPLCSNSGYRQDLAYRRKKDFARAQVQKERLEVAQRDDKKLREKFHGKAH